MVLIILDGRNPGKEELYELLLKIANSNGLSFENVKEAFETFFNTGHSVVHLAEEYKKAIEATKDLDFQLRSIKEFPPSHTNPYFRQYKRKRR